MQGVSEYRVILIILDSVGIGELPDAGEYNDKGSNTLGNLAKAVGKLDLPNLQKMGLGNISPIQGIPPYDKPKACFGKMAEKSKGKDTITGHWELMGLISNTPFPTYPNDFPKQIIDPFEKAIGTKILGNKPASGTEIIKELGEEHIKTGCPIVYTSADSVFQIAAHEEIIPIEKLYSICETARNILKAPHHVARVIARPFIGKPGSFKRTDRRKDFSIKPPVPTLLDNLNSTLGIGKIWDIFSGCGVTKSIHIKNNLDGIQKTLSAIKSKTGFKLIFTNLIDFDMLYGHRNNISGYYDALKEFDSRIPEFIDSLDKNDILVVTADHGCDPTASSTDHSREYVPILVYGQKIKSGVNLGIRSTFSDLAQTLAQLWDLPKTANGTSFLSEIISN